MNNQTLLQFIDNNRQAILDEMVTAYNLGQYCCINPQGVITRHSIGFDTKPSSIGLGNAVNVYTAEGKLRSWLNSEWFQQDELKWKNQ